MRPETYTALLKDLQKLQKTLVASQLEATRRDPALAARMARLHAEAEVGGRLDDFVGTAARKSTVLFLLRSVFVRVLEDLGILGLKRIRDDWGFAAFREVAPALGLRAYFAFVFRDLAVDFPALFSPSEDELPLPSEDGCRALWNLWHHPNRDGEHYTWDGGRDDAFESRFLGDLYQDLDADIRKRYALLQTPRFVEEYILDHTLTPALVEFDPARLRGGDENSTQRRKGAKAQEEGGDRGDAGDARTFRLLDPTCGSGHFLIGAFHRLADYWKARECDEITACERALEGVWGCDINPHAVEIAHFRLLLEYVTRTGVKDLERLAKLRPNLRAMDSLIPWERASQQADLFPARDRLDAYATPKQREENAAFLGREFHVVVGNPPYITPKDVGKRRDYAIFWPGSCFMNYAMSAPFVERFFRLGRAGAQIGQITANSFMKRQFGKPVIEKILPQLDLTGVVDTSGAYIPGHGTPTVILFGRNQAPADDAVWSVLGKRGEPKRPAVAAEGVVWRAIVAASKEASDESAFVTIASVLRARYGAHPWSLGGGWSREIASNIENATEICLSAITFVPIGLSCVVGEDETLTGEDHEWRRHRVSPRYIYPMIDGDSVRDFSICTFGEQRSVLLPMSSPAGEVIPLSQVEGGMQRLWPAKQILRRRRYRGAHQMEEAGKTWYEPRRVSREKFQTEATITFAFVSTHNQFVLDVGVKVFGRTAPVIKLPPTATLEDHLDLLGLLNSSTLGFWMKQVFHNKGSSSGEAIRSEDWEPFWEYDSTKLQQAPITPKDREPRIALARALDATAQARAACLPAALLAAKTWSPTSLGQDLAAAHERFLAHTRRMVALQEELDWLTYGSYGLIEPIPVVAPDSVEPLAPGHRPFEIVLARKDDEADDDEKSAWWSRHGHARVTEIPEAEPGYSEAHRARLQQRIELIESDARLALLETPPYKRRWQLADWPTETKKAAESWLLDRLEDLFAPAAPEETENSTQRRKDAKTQEEESVPEGTERSTQRRKGAKTQEAESGSNPDSRTTAPSPSPSPSPSSSVFAPLRLCVEFSSPSPSSPGPLAEPRPYRLEDIALAWSRDPRVAAVAGVWTGTGLSVDLTLVAEKLLRAHALPDNPHRVYSDEGLRKLAEWKRVWALQDQEDANLPLTDPDDPSPTAKRLDVIPLPPKFDKADFVRAEYFSTRGKLNVPRERFILFAELQPNRFGWNGWRDRERALAQVEAYTLAEGDPLAPLPAPTADDPRRCGVTFGLWESLPDVRRWGAADEHAELQALAREACRQPRCPCPLVEAWKPLVLHAKVATAASRQATAKANARAEAKTKAAEEASVSLAQRAWVADLFKAAEALDAGAVWTRHQAKLAEPVAGSAQLTMPGLSGCGVRGAEEHAGLDEVKLARVLDDLVASGDLDVTGRGKKKRYQVVGRAGAQ